ncbi:MAG: 2-polyprenyl-6-methoxyphenol hydroxylase-like FAD-dependent oxidoreductase [Paracoccaceae bacterium]|jgi:2-polyprenyl-6-methoxyphenol hydroxylase-like FAD-dependent oxidoreductase
MLTPRLNIAIAGCGIGGLALAALLAKQNHSVIIFDQFEQPEPVGSGLVIQPVGQAVLAATGALQQAQCFGNPINRLKGRTAPNNRRVLDVSYGKYQAGLAIHRASLFETLLSAAKSAGIKLCSNAQVIQSDLVEGGRNLQFKNRAMEGPFDLVVDATGAKSPLSPLINRKLPFGALWATVDWPHETKLPKNHLTQKYRAASIMAGVLPIGTLPNDTNPKAAIFWSLPNADFPAWRAAPLNEWKNAAQAHWLEFAPFLDQIRQHDDFTMATYSHGTLRIPIGNRLVHIGDAAHTASPQLGQGANMAL